MLPVFIPRAACTASSRITSKSLAERCAWLRQAKRDNLRRDRADTGRVCYELRVPKKQRQCPTARWSEATKKQEGPASPRVGTCQLASHGCARPSTPNGF